VKKGMLPHKPEHVLEQLYYSHLGHGLGQSDNTFWGFATAFKELKMNVTNEHLTRYRNYFIEHGWGQFDGDVDPCFRITELGEDAARKSISRRLPIYSLRRLRTYDWSFIGAIASVIAAIFACASLVQSSCNA
jgi:hypothetical protein